MSAQADSLPLSGISVLDFTTLLPGPLATLLLSEAGAEVVKIEPPAGDGMRGVGPAGEGGSAIFTLLNAGKKSVVLDLKDEAGRDRLMPLVRKADVLVEQFRPGVMDRLGLGYESLKEANPGLVYCSITGYGQDGPLARRAGHDLNYLSETGLLALNPGPEGSPQVPPFLAADIAGGSYPAVMNILLALRQRGRTGKGRHLDISMAEGLFPFAFWALAEGWSGNGWPRPGAHLFTGGTPRYRVYPCGGGLVAVGAIEDKFWTAFCEAIELPQKLRAPGADAAAVIGAVQAILAGRPATHWQRVFDAADCCCSVVKDLADATASPHFRERGIFPQTGGTKAGEPLPPLPLPLAPPFRSADRDRRAPALGEHTDAMLKERD